MRLPTYDEIARDEEQLGVLEHPLDQSLFVVGPPGSGKTILAVRRARMAAEQHDSTTVVTYNRMLRRLLDLAGVGTAEVWTMHAFVWTDYRRRTEEEPPMRPNDPYSHDWSSMLDRLEAEGGSSQSTHLIIDEGQDLPAGFFAYGSSYVAQTLTVFSDEDQALSHQRTTLEQIKSATDLGDPIVLRRNHRNTPEVARLAEHFHSGRLPVAAVSRASSGEIPRLVRHSDIADVAERVSNWYKTRGGSIGAIVHNNKTGKELRKEIRRRIREERVDLYTSQDRNEDEIDVSSPGVTVLNKESVKGQEFDAVFILELECFIPCANDAERRAMYMMCARARDYLFLVHGPELSTAAVGDLPGPDVLERS